MPTGAAKRRKFRGTNFRESKKSLNLGNKLSRITLFEIFCENKLSQMTLFIAGKENIFHKIVVALSF